MAIPPFVGVALYTQYNSITDLNAHTPSALRRGVKDTDVYPSLHIIPVDAKHSAHASALARCLCYA